jgi:hypothetical protein
MHRNKKQCLAEHVRRFRTRFMQSVGTVLGNVLSPSALTQWVVEETGPYRERIYSPFTTLMLFIEQVLGRGYPRTRRFWITTPLRLDLPEERHS